MPCVLARKPWSENEVVPVHLMFIMKSIIVSTSLSQYAAPANWAFSASSAPRPFLARLKGAIVEEYCVPSVASTS